MSATLQPGDRVRFSPTDACFADEILTVGEKFTVARARQRKDRACEVMLSGIPTFWFLADLFEREV